MATFGAAAVATNQNPNKSIEVSQPPSDSVSSLCFSPKANILVATSWDNQVRCWEISRSGTGVASVPKASISHDHPVLCSTWKDDGTTVFSGGCDKQVKMWPLLSGGQPVTVAMHDAPIKEVAWIPEMNLLATGSWDKTLKSSSVRSLCCAVECNDLAKWDNMCMWIVKRQQFAVSPCGAMCYLYWDTRQPNPVHTQQLPDRCYALTVRYPLMVVGTADRNLVVFNLQNPQTEFKRINSPLKYQTRCVAAFPDQQGFLVGSIEGRVGVHHLDDSQQSKNFTFKCHRDGSEIYSVNSLNFHPIHHTFATAGSDGAFNFWDKDSKQRLKAMSRCGQPIPCSTFNTDGSIFAYSVCYDWSKGAENHNPATAKTYIYLHLPQETEVKGKPRAGTSGRK
ncbi:protein RAE1 [Citrus sinensis]|uniref:Protein RAE1 n=2 Tax=Citrus sinensis TaxID=2711 RepID=A0ACB8JCX4_CITSI|nr:protein RAE1 [Citrus sinensis]